MVAMIDLEELTGDGEVQNLSGRLRGLAAREKFRIDALDNSPETVSVHVPSYVYSVTPSFFQGLFGASLAAFGHDSERFRRHFRFDAPSIVLQQIERGISAVLTSRNLDEIR